MGFILLLLTVMVASSGFVDSATRQARQSEIEGFLFKPFQNIRSDLRQIGQQVRERVEEPFSLLQMLQRNAGSQPKEDKETKREKHSEPSSDNPKETLPKVTNSDSTTEESKFTAPSYDPNVPLFSIINVPCLGGKGHNGDCRKAV